MKNYSVIFFLLMQGGEVLAQTGSSVSNPAVLNILKGNYDPAVYKAATVITNPDTISIGLLQGISPDSLKATLFKMRSFQNRNMFSDTSSATRGIGAARRWVYDKFLEYRKTSGNRLQVSYLQFNYNPSHSSVGCPNSLPLITRHSNIMAVLPGSQTDNKSIIIVEGHIDSRNDSLCAVTTNAFGIGDNATGTALVMELARIMSRYTFKSTIIFSVNTGEEQGLIGAHALASYLDSLKVPIRAVNNNDVSGGIFCGHTASAPGCPFYGNVDSNDLRIFSKGDINSPYKQWARYIKLEYKEQLAARSQVPTSIQIMENEDRSGRGGDHQAFSALGYTAVRFTQANEDGDASNAPGYTDRQHNIRDSLGLDKDGDGIEDSLYVDPDYLARNTLINGNSMAMAGLGPDTLSLKAKVITYNLVALRFTSAAIPAPPAYRVAVRSATNDWDTVYTLTSIMDTVEIPYGSNTTFYISAAAVDSFHTESQFSTEYALSNTLFPLYLATDPSRQPAPDPAYYGIQLMPNKPNPFDESTLITIRSGTDLYENRTFVNISTLDGRIIRRIRVPLKTGLNEVLFDHGFGMTPGLYLCSLLIDGLPVQTTKMLFRFATD